MLELADARREGLSLRRVAAIGVLATLALGACQVANVPETQATSSLSSITRTVETVTPTTSASASTIPEKTTAKPTTAASIDTPKPVQGEAGCLPYFDVKAYVNHEYEVCTALVFNAESVALQAFYKYGNNRVSYLSAPARHHFETRYFDQLRESVESQVDSWPKTSKLTGNKVKEDIYVQSVSSNLGLDRGLVTTQERWSVTSPDGSQLLNTPLQNRAFTLCRGQQPGHPLHEWVVVKNQIDKNFDCINFNRINGFAS
jgi:hypothetical protein